MERGSHGMTGEPLCTETRRYDDARQSKSAACGPEQVGLYVWRGIDKTMGWMEYAQ
jgi:hypothetical protein